MGEIGERVSDLNKKDIDKSDLVIGELKKKFAKIIPKNEADFILAFVEGMLLMHRFMILTENYFKMEGTSKGRFLILARLLVSNSKEGESISDLLPFYPISPATISGILDTLEKDGMIERISNPSDRRRVNVRIKDKGKAFMIDFLPKHLVNVKNMVKEVTETERDILPVLFRKLNSGVEDVINTGGSKNFNIKNKEQI